MVNIAYIVTFNPIQYLYESHKYVYNWISLKSETEKGYVSTIHTLDHSNTTHHGDMHTSSMVTIHQRDILSHVATNHYQIKMDHQPRDHIIHYVKRNKQAPFVTMYRVGQVELYVSSCPKDTCQLYYLEYRFDNRYFWFSDFGTRFDETQLHLYIAADEICSDFIGENVRLLISAVEERRFQFKHIDHYIALSNISLKLNTKFNTIDIRFYMLYHHETSCNINMLYRYVRSFNEYRNLTRQATYEDYPCVYKVGLLMVTSIIINPY